MGHIFCDMEILTKGWERCKNFYTSFFKWQIKFFEANYYGFSITGLMKMGEFRPGFINYILVDKRESLLEKISHLGGRVIKGKMVIPNIGWQAIVSDSDGS